MNRLSRIFQPITMVSKTATTTHKDLTSKSQRLMLELGIIHQGIPGGFHFLPLGLRALEKLIKLVDEEMQAINGQKVMFPTLVKSELWDKSGRTTDMGPELITLQDRHNQRYILGPTHEETVSHLLFTLPPMSYKHFPLLLYQITSKFRDEMKPRFGLIRCRQFEMKDMYSFDLTKDLALKSYETVCKSYEKVFQKIGIPFVKVLGSSGAMGGNLSHEYHYSADIGDDEILTCPKCNYAANIELLNDSKCGQCGDSSQVTIQKAIEVGHTFYLGDKYSKALKATYLDANNKPQILQMGSYGIGISRVLAASLECLSSEHELRWPDSISPFNVVIVPPKSGSKEDKEISCTTSENLYTNLESYLPPLKNNIALDDRTHLTIGRRLLDCRRTGFRFIIVLNQKTRGNPPVFELNDIVKNQQMHLTEYEIATYIKTNGQFAQRELAAGC